MTIDRIERMRQAQQARGIGTAVTPAPAPATPPPKAPRPKPPPRETVNRACGHTTAVAWLEAQPCQACQDAAIAAGRVARRQKHEQRRATGQKDRLLSGRLPHGSAFSARYDAERVLWTGTLKIQAPSGEVVFSASCNAVLHLMPMLDRQYRAWLAGTLVLGEPRKEDEPCGTSN